MCVVIIVCHQFQHVQFVMAEEVSRVAQRCEEAKQSLVLDLSHCELMSLPEAVFFIVKNVQLREVNLSHNKLKKLPKKFSSRFAAVTSESLIAPFTFNTLVTYIRVSIYVYIMWFIHWLTNDHILLVPA